MLEEAASRHRSGDVQAHHGQNRGCDVSEDAAIGIQTTIALTKVNQGHGLGSVLGVWLVVFVVAHLLTIAVIRCDQTFATRSKQRCFEARRAYRDVGCEFDGKLSVVAFGGELLLYARANLHDGGGV